MTIKRLYIDRDIKDHPQTHSICRRLALRPSYVDAPDDLYRTINNADEPVTFGKSLLYLTRNKGGFFKKCPGTREYLCCDYQILHVASFCTMDCSYCILQIYFHPPMLTYFVNREDLDAELDALFDSGQIARVGTGEFTDSLIWEPWTDLNGYLVRRFAGQERAVLELKTKSVNIKKMKGLDHRRKTIMAWSLNTPFVIKNEERFTAPLEARLDAARQCQKWGYPLAFHFDPMVLYPGCEIDYQQVINMLFKQIDSRDIVWISLGTFRFMPPLKGLISRRFPKSKIAYGEFITGLDNKMRYFKPLRIDLYRRMVAWIKEKAPQVTVYFCMEDDVVWEQATGFVPSAGGGVGRLLDESATRVCGLKP